MKKILLSVLLVGSACLASPADSIKTIISKIEKKTNALKAQGTFIRPSILVLPTIATPSIRFSPPKGLQSSDIIQVVNSGFCSFSRFDIKEGPSWLSTPFIKALNAKNATLPQSAANVDRVRSSFLISDDAFNDEFSQNIDDVAQATLGEAYANVLSDPAEAQKRATALLNEADQNSMMSDKAKLEGTELITQEQVDLANNASYIAIPVVEQSTHEIISSLFKGRVGQRYKIRMGAYIFKVHKDQGQFKLSLKSKQMYNGETAVIDSTFKQDINYRSGISKDEYAESTALNSVLFKFQAGLKEISDFQLGSQIYNADGRDFAFDTRKSEAEDISMDDKFWMKELVEEEDGSESWDYLGWSNVVGTPRDLDTSYQAEATHLVRRQMGQVDDYCELRQSNDYSQESNSLAMFEAQAITGSPEEGAIVEEVPRMNLDLQVAFKRHAFQFMIGDSLSSAEQINAIDVQFKSSMAETFKFPNISFIARLSASIAGVSPDTTIEISSEEAGSFDVTPNAVGTMGLTLGLQKGFYLWRFYPYIQAGAGFQALYILGDADQGSFGFGSGDNLNFDAYRPYLGFEFEAGTAFFFTPNVSLNAAIGHQAYAGLGSFEYNISDSSEDYVENEAIDIFDNSHFNGLSYYLGFTMNTWPFFKYF